MLELLNNQITIWNLKTMLIALAIIISLSLLVFFHEFGHFIFGRILGVKVEEFGFGYPPRLCGIVKINGRRKFFWSKNVPQGERETVYSLNWIPFGGFNKFKGDEAGATESDSLYGQSWWKRILIAFGGPIMNIFLAMILFCSVFNFGSYQEITPEILQKKLLIKDVGLRIIAIMPNSPAEKAGLKLNDRIISLNGQQFFETEELTKYVKKQINQSIKIQVERKNKILEFIIQPKLAKEIYKDEKMEGAAIGIVTAKIGRVYYPFHLAIEQGIIKTFVLLGSIFQTAYLFFKELIVHQKLIGEVVGVVGIAAVTAEAAQIGLVYLMQFVAMLSLLLTLTQLLPFPALDGGRVIFFLIEGIAGRPVNPKIENAINSLGFTLLLILAVYITYRDLMKLGDQLFKR